MVAISVTLLHPSLLSHYPCTTTTSTRSPPLSTNFGNFSLLRNSKLRKQSHICYSTANESSTSSPQISSDAKIRSEVLTPFRTVRMFFYLAFIASGGLGTLISITQLIPSLINPSKSQYTPEILKSLLIDLAAVLLFAFLYTRENKAKNLQLARLSREENLSKLKLRINENKVIPMSEFRGLARIVIVAGPGKFILESFERSKEFTNGLVERGVLVVPFCTDRDVPVFKFEGENEDDEKRKRLWQLTPVITSSWAEWIDEQKKLANVAPESPVYLSLRMDGRVRGSGVGYPPWNAFVAQLPPIKGIWTGLLDGMDGRV